jgi:outer membrane protein
MLKQVEATPMTPRQKDQVTMMPNRAAFALTAALAGAGLALPAQAQTLQEALAYAYSNNPTLLTARALLRATDENVPQALAGWRPQVTASSSGGYVDQHNRSVGLAVNGNPLSPEFGRQFSAPVNLGTHTHADRATMSNTITATQPIYRGGRTVASIRRAENQVFGQRARLMAAEQQVFGDTVNAYVGVVQNQELLRLNINNEQVLTEQLRATNERFRVGEITRTDVAQAEARLAGAKAARQQAEGNLDTARATFMRMVGVAAQRLTAPQPLRQPVRNAEEAGQLAANNNPGVVAALFDESAARDNIDIQVGALLPQLSAQAQGFRTDNAAQQHTRLTGAQATLNLSVPIYQGGAEYAAVRQARQQAQQARAVVDDQRRQAMQQAASAWATLASARAQVESTRVQIRANEVALDGVQREAIVGSRTTLEVLNAEQELLNSRTSLVQALANVVSASYSVASAVGRLNAIDLALPVQLYDARAYYAAVRDRWFGLGDYAQTAGR